VLILTKRVKDIIVTYKLINKESANNKLLVENCEIFAIILAFCGFAILESRCDFRKDNKEQSLSRGGTKPICRYHREYHYPKLQTDVRTYIQKLGGAETLARYSFFHAELFFANK